MLLAVHGDEGSIGFIMNRPADIKVDALIQGFPDFDAPVYFGGPVQNDQLHFLHRCGDLVEGAEEIYPGIYLDGNFNQLRFIIEKELVTPRDVRFFLGYSGWSEGQLNEEIDLGSWVMAP
ncbi:MAG: YqgE/AlgH family protein, partial [Lewinella sp.]|nr:YqgE/AlgH family protein [Lewinella sp.]